MKKKRKLAKFLIHLALFLQKKNLSVRNTILNRHLKPLILKALE
jgi:hypothetical protein